MRDPALSMPQPQNVRPFRLLRWFALLSAVVIASLAVANAVMVSRFLTEQMLQREGEVSRDFVQNVLTSDGSLEILRAPDDPELRRRFAGSVLHLGNLRDVVRANVYTRDHKLLWSTNKELVGQTFHDNDELEDALQDKLVVNAGHVQGGEPSKAEYAGLALKTSYFVETYIPIKDARGEVLGVIELYKVPVALSEAIETARWRVGLLAVVGAALLFGALYGVVRRADRMLRLQHAQLLEAETLAAVGEMAAAVAHNVRNPLASIRSSAELALDAPLEQARESAHDILRDADRISARINELLRLAKPAGEHSDRVNLPELLSACAAEQKGLFERRQQSLTLTLPAGTAHTHGDAALLRHLLDSLLVNAAEAMGTGGRCNLRLVRGAAKGFHRIELEDNGPGMTPEVLGQVTKPFFTTKPQGLGLGLALARRTVERLGGRLNIRSKLGQGTTLTLDFPEA